MPTLIPSPAQPMPLISIGEASIGSSYALVGTFTSWAQILIITSTVNAEVTLSFDGVHDHIAVPAGNSEPVIFPIDFKSNLMTLPTPSVYAKSAGSPSTGTLYVSGFSSSTQ